MSDNMSVVKVTSRDFQRDFARMKARANSGEIIFITSNSQEFVFQSVQPRSWQGALKGKVKIVGDISSTGVAWEASK